MINIISNFLGGNGLSKQTLEDFMKENIHNKLGLKSTTFRPEHLPNFAERRVEIGAQNAEGAFSAMPEPMYPHPRCQLSQGYRALFHSARVHRRVGNTACRGGNVLKPESVE
ncbi:hypothetical protein ACJ72_02797 [Emergomyces africanus]|uniref:Uncharacterized protein n=1 Tax=Emergomyces africanus TaxID=1955775 RepID=A0A1B7P1D8_9EURO|nr:hypothetical protein ACJ72_02797 [Emergomyces africanus]